MALQLLPQFKKDGEKTYKYYSIAEPYFENGKNKKRIIARLGKLEDEQAEKIKLALKLTSNDERGIYSLSDLSLEKVYSYLDVAFIEAIIRDLGISDILPETRNAISIRKIFALLLIHRILKPGSKLASTRWVKETVLPDLLDLGNMEIEPQHVYRALPEIENTKEKFENFLFSKIAETGPIKNVFYDMTSSYFEGECVEHSAFSENSKDHRSDKLQLMLGLLVNEKGVPFSWDIFAGNQGESPTFIGQVDKLKERFNIESTLLVFDRGFLSNKNIKAAEEAGYSYLTALDSPQVENIVNQGHVGFLESLNESNVEEKLEKNNLWSKYDEGKYYSKEDSFYNSHRLVLTFDITRFKRSRYSRGDKIEVFKKWVDKENERLANFKKDAFRDAIAKDVDTELVRLGIKKYISYELHGYTTDSQVFVRAKNNPFPSQGYTRSIKTLKIVFSTNLFEKLDGVYGLISSPKANLSVEEIIHCYKEKIKIEFAFRTMKSFLKLRPWYVYKDEHVRAHYTICVVAYFIEKLIEQKLKDAGKNLEYSVQSLLEELSVTKLGIMKLGKQHKAEISRCSDALKGTLKTLGYAKILNPSKLQDKYKTLYRN